jgi:uncharacterized protein
LACLAASFIVPAMQAVRALGIYILTIFIGGALLAPVLYGLVQSFAESFPQLADNPFHRFLNRSFLALALLGLWPLFRSLGAQNWRDVGLVNPKRKWYNFGAGFAVGFASLALVALIALGVGARLPISSVPHLGQKLFGAALTALTVGIIEEILFRGGIFGALRRNLNWVAALLLSSSVYAIVHFLGNPQWDGQVTWSSGLELLPHMLAGFIDWQQLVPGFFNLTLAGVILGLAYHRTGNLYFSIGLHAGWIFWLKSYGSLTREAPGANTWIWGGSKMTDGWLALCILGGTLLCVTRICKHLESNPQRINPSTERE